MANAEVLPENKNDLSERIRRIRRRYQTGDAYLSVERARLYTQSWRQTENTGMGQQARVAYAMKNVYENMTMFLDPDDRIAGTWTEFFTGMPIDIEKGVYNGVLEAELTRPRMVRFRGQSMAKGLSYLLRNHSLKEFAKNQRSSRASGASPLNLELKTMPARQINSFKIKDNDRRLLLGKLLPYWNGRALTDLLEKELASSGLLSREMNDFVISMAGSSSRQIQWLSSCATIATIQGHLVLDYDHVLRDGTNSMLAEVESRLGDDAELSSMEKEFLQAQRIAYEGVNVFATRVADRVEEELHQETDSVRKKQLAEMLLTCRTAPFKPTQTFPEAVQALWTVKTAVELAHPANLHCFGRLDQNLYPYYKRDLEAGRITREGARETLEELLLKVMSQNMRPESNILGNFYHRFLGSTPVTLGGLTSDGENAANELTELFIEAAARSRAITNISVRISEKTPDAVLDKVAQHLETGASSYSLFNDEVTTEAMRRKGFTEEDARNYAIMGCVEATCPGKTGAMSASGLLLARLLDLTMRNGNARTLAGLIRGDGLRTGDPDDFADFEEFLDALFKQGRHFIHHIVDGSNLRDRVYAKHLPAPYISAFMDGCLDTLKDVTHGGARYDLSGISMINSIANLVDSLLVIKRLVFEKRELTFRELLEAVDANFEGHEDVARKIRNVEGKWGNGNLETDALAHRVASTLFKESYHYKNERGGPFVVYVISMISHTVDGRLSIAGPDGRKASTPFAASCNPSNVDKSGSTATLRSVAALPFEDVMGSAVNMKFHSSAIGRTEKTRKKWIALIRTYFQMGGAQLQPTVADTETLRAAQTKPDEYRDLIVKVGGYSTYFVDLGREIQSEVIARTEHLS